MNLNGYLSLADFGMSKFQKQLENEEDELSLAGTPEYLGTILNTFVF